MRAALCARCSQATCFFREWFIMSQLIPAEWPLLTWAQHAKCFEFENIIVRISWVAFKNIANKPLALIISIISKHEALKNYYNYIFGPSGSGIDYLPLVSFSWPLLHFACTGSPVGFTIWLYKTLCDTFGCDLTTHNEPIHWLITPDKEDYIIYDCSHIMIGECNDLRNSAVSALCDRRQWQRSW